MEDLDTLVRRVDEDRWLASRFAPEPVRAPLTAIYAVNYEIARTAEIVREPGIGLIRLAWWREALEEIAQGAEPRAHPALTAYASATAGTTAPPNAWTSMIEARGLDWEAEPFANWADMDAYLDATAGSVIRLALAACGASGAEQALAVPAGRAWGCAGLLRSRAAWSARGRSALPRAGGSPEEMMQRAKDAHAETRARLGAVSSRSFPAVGYLSFVPAYRRALTIGEPSLPLLSRQLRLVLASATGRI